MELWNKYKKHPVFIITFALGLAFLLRTGIVEAKKEYKVGVNVYMDTSLSCDDARFYISKMKFNTDDITKGDHVIVEVDRIEGLFEDPTKMTKVVAGIGGDTIKLTEKDTFINGLRVAGREKLDRIKELGLSDDLRENKEYTIPEGHIFLLGKQLEHSFDSRYWGVVKKDQVKGKIIWSI